ncbi:hypothetical protein [Methanorbis furvi]|uniref:Uncharacterized protein n=1 Tax=Methanorbis furvi TaxID=3028299 RepID=A0AAE4MCF6_9EURY|nr:hypothetical protein [Methanocorpusculaceae archaeon Ag1]
MSTSSVTETKTGSPAGSASSTTLSPAPTIVDRERGISLISDQLGVGIRFIKAGETTDEVTGKLIKWNDSVKLVSGDKVLKLTALQADYIRRAFNNSEVAAELKSRKDVELAKLLAELQGSA